MVDCALCGKKLGFITKLKPKKEWGIDGMLCFDCYNEKNSGIKRANDQPQNTMMGFAVDIVKDPSIVSSFSGRYRIIWDQSLTSLTTM